MAAGEQPGVDAPREPTASTSLQQPCAPMHCLGGAMSAHKHTLLKSHRALTAQGQVSNSSGSCPYVHGIMGKFQGLLLLLTLWGSSLDCAQFCIIVSCWALV